MRKKMKFLEPVLLLVGGTLVSLLLGEGALRVVERLHDVAPSSLASALQSAGDELPPPGTRVEGLRSLIRPATSKEIVFELKPNLDVVFMNARVRTNSAGFRGAEVPREKPADTFRIIGIGDSVMFGWGVEEESSYLKVIERDLNQRGDKRRYEVLNFAVPGYNSAMEAATLLEKAAPYEPDLIIIHFVRNDFAVPSFMVRPTDVLSTSRSYLWDFASRFFPSREPEKDALVGVDFEGIEEADQQEVLAEYRDLSGVDAFKNAYNRIGTFARSREIPVVVVYGSAGISQRGYLSGASRTNGFELVRVQHEVERFFKEQGIADDPSARAAKIQVSRNDPHPNAIGHEIYARAVMGRLRKRRLVPALIPPAPSAQATSANGS